MKLKPLLGCALACALIGGSCLAQVVASGLGGFVAVTLGTTSTQVLLQVNGRTILAIDNESATASIACRFGSAAAALNTAGSFTIPPGITRFWNHSYVPSDALQCIASNASTPVTIEAN